jgi:putative membrane protein
MAAAQAGDGNGMPTPILTDEQIKRITQAVAEAESRTSGQIVPVILRQSDRYPAARWRMGSVLALITALALCVLMPALHSVWVVWAEVPAFLIGYGLGSIPSLQRAFLAPLEMEEEVRQRAHEVFQLRNLAATRDRTAVLILVSLLERRVQLLADVGIDSKVAAGSWDGLVERLVRSLRSEHPATGLCAAIAECGAILGEHFPPRPGGTNELSDAPLIDS